ncbi:DNA/RNA polymerases superfamily protein [Cucumis melo var. makuwa]|uniref:DNA/RNA polymerases superfamily protein n=1 Tax=Cucumis melo var. makuwa TaxID=1194695 RepID=A0A5D3DEF5_CUCMM|nr:DNA/RNA polymerases superfamily protein [Cucumis melo var. makuwa]
MREGHMDASGFLYASADVFCHAVKTESLIEAHSSPFSMHPGLPITLKGCTVIWVVVDRLMKSAHFILGKSTYTAILEGTLGCHGHEFLATIGMAPFEALYGKCCRFPVCWDEVGEQRLMGLQLVQSTNETIHKIRERIQAAQSRQKRYADVRQKDLEFDVGDKVFLKVAPMKDPSHVVDYEPLEIDENLSYAEQPVEILAREAKILRNREIALVKVLWRNHKVKEATWEREDDIRACYPELFED